VSIAANDPAPPSSVLEGEAEPGELRRLLELERERRATLEGELVRLSASGEVAERYRESWQGLQSARADLLVLSQRLEDEQRKRQELEAEVARARSAVAGSSDDGEAPLERLVAVADDHGRETERLERELRDATEEVVRLKGRLETIDSAQSAGPVLKELHEENEKLRISLRGAETKLAQLENQAALAKRLAELIYSR
jgi:chromosome segregation ATPase